jgi:hypothetical protein
MASRPKRYRPGAYTEEGSDRMARACEQPEILKKFLAIWNDANPPLKKLLQPLEDAKLQTLFKDCNLFFMHLPSCIQDPGAIRRIENSMKKIWLKLLPAEIPLDDEEAAQALLTGWLSSRLFAPLENIGSISPHLPAFRRSLGLASLEPPPPPPVAAPKPAPKASPSSVPKLAQTAGIPLQAAIPLIVSLLKQSKETRLTLNPPPLYVAGWLELEQSLEHTVAFLEHLCGFLLKGTEIHPSIQQFLPSAEEGLIEGGSVALSRMQRDLVYGVVARWIKLAQFLAEAVPVDLEKAMPAPIGIPELVLPMAELIEALGYQYTHIPLYGPLVVEHPLLQTTVRPAVELLHDVAPTYWVETGTVLRVESPLLVAASGKNTAASVIVSDTVMEDDDDPLPPNYIPR